MLEISSPPYPTIRKELYAGNVISFLGAGTSTGVRGEDETWQDGSERLLPRASELALHLATEAGLEDAGSEDLAAIAHYYESKVGRKLLRGELHRIFTGGHPLRPIHELLADVEKPQLIVTTNYDDLIERALEARGREFDVVIPALVDDAQPLYRPHGGELAAIQAMQLERKLAKLPRTVVYKIHGSIIRGEDPQEEYVITDGDYLRFLMGMTRKQVLPAAIGKLFEQRSFLFLGYGLRDWNVRLLLTQLRPYLSSKKVREIVSWAIDELPSEISIRFWRTQAVDIYGMPLDEFAEKVWAPR